MNRLLLSLYDACLLYSLPTIYSKDLVTVEYTSPTPSAGCSLAKLCSLKNNYCEQSEDR